MDKIAIISDIHGNITALKAVLEDIRKRNIKDIYCLGDLVVKCTNPDLVIDTVRENCKIILKGNCDELVCKNKNYSWTRNKIGEERLAFLDSLPVSHEFYMSGHLIRIFHASPYSLEHLYNPMYSNINTRYSKLELNNPEQLFVNTEFLGKTTLDPVPDIVGYGHTHTPNVFRYKNYTIFNTGSVGAPMEMLSRDVNNEKNKFSTMASYAIVEGKLDSKELGEISINLIRVPYDINKEIEYINNSTIPTKDKIILNLSTGTYQE